MKRFAFKFTVYFWIFIIHVYSNRLINEYGTHGTDSNLTAKITCITDLKFLNIYYGTHGTHGTLSTDGTHTVFIEHTFYPPDFKILSCYRCKHGIHSFSSDLTSLIVFKYNLRNLTFYRGTHRTHADLTPHDDCITGYKTLTFLFDYLDLKILSIYLSDFKIIIIQYGTHGTQGTHAEKIIWRDWFTGFRILDFFCFTNFKGFIFYGYIDWHSTASQIIPFKKITNFSMCKDTYGMERRGSAEDVYSRRHTDPPEAAGAIQRHRSLDTLREPEQYQVEDPVSGKVPTGTVPMSTDEDEPAVRAELGAAHHQCLTSRRMGEKCDTTSIVTDSSFLKTIRINAEKIGSMNPPGDKDVLRTFRGVRMQRGGAVVNQYITMSFDPTNLQCLSCSVEHGLVQGNLPLTVVLSDENFVPTWPEAETGKCVAIVRIEGGTLDELIDTMGDIFGRSGLPEGSVILLGSVNHLHKWGVSRYARDWTRLVMDVGKGWPTARLCPLVPVIREDAPGGIVRELTELAAWFSRVYEGNIQGLNGCWTMLVTKTITGSTGGTALVHPESYTVTLPPSLDFNIPVVPHTFFTKSSRPSALKGVDKGSETELLGAIAEVLSRDFGIPVDVRVDSENVISQDNAQVKPGRIVLIGASNLHRVANNLQQLGWEVTDLTVPGWVATPANVEAMAEKLRQLELEKDAVVIYDLFGNSVYRFESYDGSVLTPVKMGGGYHLAGEVGVCSDSIFGKQIDTVMPLLEVMDVPYRVVIPPQPRYLYSGCCQDESHCTNLGQQGHAEKLMGEILHLREVLKRKLVSKLEGRFWVTDSCMATNVASDKTAKDRAESLRAVSAKDGVHFTQRGARFTLKNWSIL